MTTSRALARRVPCGVRAEALPPFVVTALKTLSATELPLLSLLRDHGWATVSFQALEPGVRLYGGETRGGVAYTDTGAAWVAAGGPIAPTEALSALARDFVDAAQANGRRACFCASEERFGPPGFARVQIGAQPTWDPGGWTAIVRGSRSLREQLRRARAKGVRIRRATLSELQPGHAVRRQLEGLVQAWLSSRKGPRLEFLLDVQLFDHLEERLVFLAESDGTVVGVLSAVPVFARQGWFIEDVLRSPCAPNGTAELLVDAAMTEMAARGSARVTMGLVPLAGQVSPWLRVVRWLCRGFYDFGGLRRFREKLKPHGWEPVYVAYPSKGLAPVALWDVMTAVMGRSPLVWCWQALRKSS